MRNYACRRQKLSKLRQVIGFVLFTPKFIELFKYFLPFGHILDSIRNYRCQSVEQIFLVDDVYRIIVAMRHTTVYKVVGDVVNRHEFGLLWCQIVEIDLRLDFLHRHGRLFPKMTVAHHVLWTVRPHPHQLCFADQCTLTSGRYLDLRMCDIFQNVRANFQSFPFIRIKVQIRFLPKEVCNTILLNFYFADHSRTRICAMPTSPQLATEFELLILTHVVHLHDLGKKFLMHVLLYFRALDGIVQVST